jgi:hypothetical protein
MVDVGLRVVDHILLPWEKGLKRLLHSKGEHVETEHEERIRRCKRKLHNVIKEHANRLCAALC